MNSCCDHEGLFYFEKKRKKRAPKKLIKTTMYNIYTICIILTIYRRECDRQRLEGEGAQNDNEISSDFIDIFSNETTSLATVHVESPIG